MPASLAHRLTMLAHLEQQISQGEKQPRILTCGCCTNGCVCLNHQDRSRGVHPHVCEFHSGDEQ